MTKEQDLYDAFVDNLLHSVKEKTATPKELDIALDFIKHNGLQASKKHKGLTELSNNVLKLPYDIDDELPQAMGD